MKSLFRNFKLFIMSKYTGIYANIYCAVCDIDTYAIDNAVTFANCKKF